MRIGVLSLYKNGYNFGAQLQAYALCRVLGRYGECEQIQYLHQHTDLHHWVKQMKSADKLERFSASIPHSAEVYDNYDIAETIDLYDVFVCGSDQIWGEKVSVPYENTAVFALSFVPSDKVKVAYAASLGGKSVSGVYDDVLKGSLKDIDFISAREKSAIPYLEAVSGRQVKHVADPVFLLSRNDWDSLVIKPDINVPFDVVYTISEDNKTLNYKSKNRIVWIDPNRDNIGPEEFLGYIKYAENVITDSYHGLVFSIIYEKNFAALSKDEALDVRLKDLLEAVDIDRELVCKGEDLFKGLQKPIFYGAVRSRIERLRTESMEFLEASLCFQKEKRSVAPEHECTGCGACIAACPAKCISWEEGVRGFYFPKIDHKFCVNCGKCESVCPILSAKSRCSSVRVFDMYDGTKPSPKVYSVKNKDLEIMMQSSSEGVFYELAEPVISGGGVVYGARFDKDFNVVSARAETIEEIHPLMTSKYAQSDCRRMYVQIEKDLKEQREVLVCAAPCQIAAVRTFLGRDYEKLITVDFICYGVPSNDAWKKYLKEYEKKGKMKAVNMRYKPKGINDYEARNILIEYEKNEPEIIDFMKDSFGRIYLGAVLFRGSCHRCKFKGNERKSDITIADFHGKAELEKAKRTEGYGSSLVLLNTEKGESYWEKIGNRFLVHQQILAEIVEYNWLYIESIMTQPYTWYMDCLYHRKTFADLYREDFICEERKSEQVFYWRKVLTEDCEKKLMSYEDGKLRSGKVILYGIGALGKLLYAKLEQKPECIIDRDPAKTEYLGTPVLRAYDAELEKNLKDSVVVVTLITDVLGIIRMLKSLHTGINVITITDFLGV